MIPSPPRQDELANGRDRLNLEAPDKGQVTKRLLQLVTVALVVIASVQVAVPMQHPVARWFLPLVVTMVAAVLLLLRRGNEGLASALLVVLSFATGVYSMLMNGGPGSFAVLYVIAIVIAGLTFSARAAAAIGSAAIATVIVFFLKQPDMLLEQIAARTGQMTAWRAEMLVVVVGMALVSLLVIRSSQITLRAVRARSENEALTHMVIQSLPDLAVTFCKPTGQVELVSQVAQSEHVHRLLAELPSVMKRVQLESGEVDVREFQLLTESGGRWYEARCFAQSQEVWFLLLRDISERVEEARRERGRQAVLIDFATGFINRPTTDFDAVIELGLGKIGVLVGAVRAAVILFRPESDLRDNTHEWCAKGVVSQKKHMQGLPRSEAAWWLEQLEQQKPLVIQDSMELPPEAEREKEALLARKVRSLVVVPMVDKRKLRGYLTVEFATPGSPYVEESVALLRLVANIVSGGLARRGVEDDLRTSEARFQRLFRYAPQAMVMVDVYGRVVQSNRNAQNLFAYDERSFVGQSFEELLPAELREDDSELDLEGMEEQLTASLAESRLMQGVRSDGQTFEAEVGIVPLSVAAETQMLAGITDISQRRAAQKAVVQSLSEKETLLKEIHHRVKNNLQIISSLLMLQNAQLEDEKSKSLLLDSVHRVRSMALVHQQLYGMDSLEKIELGAYSRLLTESLRAAFAATARIEVRTEKIEVSVDVAVPFGLILNELVTNACKYGLGETNDAKEGVLVEVKANSDSWSLAVKDCGNGLPKGFDLHASTGLGLQLVTSLTKQLRGTIQASSDRTGARFELNCPFKVEDMGDVEQSRGNASKEKDGSRRPVEKPKANVSA